MCSQACPRCAARARHAGRLRRVSRPPRASLTSLTLSAPQVPGVIPPDSYGEAKTYFDMLVELVESTKALVDDAVLQREQADTFVAGGPLTARTAAHQEKKALSAKNAAWRRVRFAERKIAEKAPFMATVGVFKSFAKDVLGYSEKAYGRFLQRLVHQVHQQRDRMQEHFPEDVTVTRFYSLSDGGVSAGGTRKRGRGSPYDFEPLDIAWLAAAPHGFGYRRRLQLQHLYGCGHTALDEAVRLYNEARAREELFDETDDYDYDTFMYCRVHLDEEGRILKEVDEDTAAEMIAGVRKSNLNLGAFTMMKELRRAYPDIYFSYYIIAKILAQRDFSKRIYWAPEVVRCTIWSPHSLWSLHLDGHDKCTSSAKRSSSLKIA